MFTKWTSLVGLMLLLAKTSTARCSCGRRNTARISGGAETGENEFPMMAAIVNKVDGRFRSAATIISDRYALTAAHTYINKPRNQSPRYIFTVGEVNLLVGEHDLSKDSQVTEQIAIDTIIYHRKFNITGYFDNDIALVYLAASIWFSRNMGPVCLPFGDENNLFEDQQVMLLGWGGTPTERLSNTLQILYTTVDKEITCRKSKYSRFSTFCTNTPQGSHCKGDSGGPVLWQDPRNGRLKLIGIISVGYKICRNGRTTETRVTSYLDWIVEHAVDTSFCK